MDILVNDDLKEKLSELHISEEEIKEVINAGETGGERCHNMENRFLAKLEMEECTYYVQYTPLNKDVFQIHTAYFHRSQFKDGE